MENGWFACWKIKQKSVALLVKVTLFGNRLRKRINLFPE